MVAQPNPSNNGTLGDLIAQKIAESSCHRITFSEFMELALYHPQHGYYATRGSVIGVKGDFFTSPHLESDFGELLAEQFVQMWEILQRPAKFTLVEMGAGQGLLATDILRDLQQKHPEFCASLEYLIIERAAPLIAEQRRQLQRFENIKIDWKSWEDLNANSVTGCFFSNELVDALPVHLWTIADGRLQEIYVTVQDSQFREVLAEPSTPALSQYLDRAGVKLDAYADRYRSEVNLAALDWISTVADRLQQGYVLTIDYGYTHDRYYHPARSEGTLQCYYRHAHHSDPYIHVGQQDITAHVDFTALQQQGEQSGLQTVGFTQQGLFLMALGLGDRMAAIRDFNATTPEAVQAVLRRRDALHQLASPLGLGSFGVLVQSKGVETAITLKGLRQ
ncbi:MAG TPA: class I SAM-dependent methyltransferase [Thermosynechococcaceae cyanobacterium]